MVYFVRIKGRMSETNTLNMHFIFPLKGGEGYV